MNNTERLAIEHGILFRCWDELVPDNVTLEKLEAFAKAYAQQQSERDMTQPKDSEREDFEASFSVSKNIKFDAEFNRYFDAETGKNNIKITNLWEGWQAKALQQSSEPVAYLKRKKMSEEAIKLLPNQAMRNVQREKGWSDWYGIKAEDSCDDWMHDYESIPLFTHPPASVQLEKYIKLLERLRVSNKHIKDWWNNFGEGGSNLPPAHSARLVDENEQAIAEAEGKDG